MRVRWIQTPEREPVGHHTLGRFHYDGGIKGLPSDWGWSESSVEVSNTCVEPGPVRLLLGFQYD